MFRGGGREGGAPHPACQCCRECGRHRGRGAFGEGCGSSRCGRAPAHPASFLPTAVRCGRAVLVRRRCRGRGTAHLFLQPACADPQYDLSAATPALPAASAHVRAAKEHMRRDDLPGRLQQLCEAAGMTFRLGSAPTSPCLMNCPTMTAGTRDRPCYFRTSMEMFGGSPWMDLRRVLAGPDCQPLLRRCPACPRRWDGCTPSRERGSCGGGSMRTHADRSVGPWPRTLHCFAGAWDSRANGDTAFPKTRPEVIRRSRKRDQR